MPRFRSKAAGLLVASAAVLLTAACGGNSGSSGTSGGGEANPGSGGGNAFAAYTQCLSQNGVTITMPSFGARDGASRGPGSRPSGMPRPSGSAGQRGGGFPGGGGFAKPDGVDDATWQKAQTACASLRPSGRAGGNGNGGGRNAAYENCLKDNGVTTGAGQLNTADPAVAKAMETCKVLRQAAPSASPTA